MKSTDSSARTIGLIGLSIFLHGAAFWAFNENLSLRQMAQIIEATRAQANKSQVWEKISQNSQEVEIELDSAAEMETKDFEFKKVESVAIASTEQKAEQKPVVKRTVKKGLVEPPAKSKKNEVKEIIATELPKKEVIKEVKNSNAIPKTTVTTQEEPENLEPEIRLVPANQWLDGVAAAEVADETSTEATAQIEKTPPEIEETDLLSELKSNEDTAEETAMQKIRSYLGLRQADGNRPPQYPLEARKHGIQGRVLLQYFVTEKGSVEDIKVAQSSGHKILDDEAIRAVSSYRFYPGQSGWTEHPVKFSLKGIMNEIPNDLGASTNN